MSRHLLLDRPDRQIVLGWDEPLRAFFGQVFRPDDPDREGIAVGGWPISSGLGVRRPVTTEAHVVGDLFRLANCAQARLLDCGSAAPEATARLDGLVAALRREWANGADCPPLPLPACLQGARP